MSNLFQDWSKNELVIYCYDKRPELYARLTAETRREDILAWLGVKLPNENELQAQLAKLEQAIKAQMGLRGILPDEQLEAILKPLQQQKVELEAQLKQLLSSSTETTYHRSVINSQADVISTGDHAVITYTKNQR